MGWSFQIYLLTCKVWDPVTSAVTCFAWTELSSHFLLLAGDLHNIFKYSERSRHPGQQTKHALYLILPQISHNWSVIIPVTNNPGQLWDRIFHMVMSSSVNKANPQEWVWGMVDPEKWGIGVCLEAGWKNPHVAIYLFTSITLHFSKHWNLTRTQELIADLQSSVQWGLFLLLSAAINVVHVNLSWQPNTFLNLWLLQQPENRWTLQWAWKGVISKL